jgi:hypothetical protein
MYPCAMTVRMPRPDATDARPHGEDAHPNSALEGVSTAGDPRPLACSYVQSLTAPLKAITRLRALVPEPPVAVEALAPHSLYTKEYLLYCPRGVRAPASRLVADWSDTRHRCRADS